VTLLRQEERRRRVPMTAPAMSTTTTPPAISAPVALPCPDDFTALAVALNAGVGVSGAIELIGAVAAAFGV
jgi:hypothetical protein